MGSAASVSERAAVCRWEALREPGASSWIRHDVSPLSPVPSPIWPRLVASAAGDRPVLAHGASVKSHVPRRAHPHIPRDGRRRPYASDPHRGVGGRSRPKDAVEKAIGYLTESWWSAPRVASAETAEAYGKPGNLIGRAGKPPTLRRARRRRGWANGTATQTRGGPGSIAGASSGLVVLERRGGAEAWFKTRLRPFLVGYDPVTIAAQPATVIGSAGSYADQVRVTSPVASGAFDALAL